ncbi:MAG: isochorismatase family protein, partial [Alphaproteobacteria bacterium]|nr:isochorismatase family protein [Alphaproteobacteria bacterium]
TEGPMTDMGLWHKKIPAEELKAGSKAVEIDDRIAPLDNELVIVKKRASAFHGTPLAGFLRAAGVDTVIVTGATACACVRSSIEDALAEGFRPIAVRECIGDRIPGAVEWSLFDVDAKFGDVELLETVMEYLRRNDIG